MSRHGIDWHGYDFMKKSETFPARRNVFDPGSRWVSAEHDDRGHLSDTVTVID
jgi:hypothetical protein